MKAHYNLGITGVATRTIPLFRATDAGVLVGASFSQEGDTDGDKTFKIRNVTRGVDMSQALDIDALAALGHADIPVAAAVGDRAFRKGDLIAAVYTVTTAGAAGPTAVGLELDLEYVSHSRGTGQIGG